MSSEHEFGDAVEYGTILQEFRQQVHKWGNKAAIIYENENQSITYQELQNQSRALAQELRTENNSIIAILLPCGFEHILSVLSVLEASKTYCPLSMDNPPSKLMAMLQELGNPLLITTKATVQYIGLDYENMYLLDKPKPLNLKMVNTLYENPNEAELGAIYFTSGSTGTPKAAMLGNKTLVRFFKAGIIGFNLGPTDKSACILNPGFILNIFDVFMILLSGGTIHIPPFHLRYDIPALRDWVRNTGTVTFMMMVSSTGERFFNAEPEAFPPSLRKLGVAGEKLQTGPRPDAPFRVYR